MQVPVSWAVVVVEEGHEEERHLGFDCPDEIIGSWRIGWVQSTTSRGAGSDDNRAISSSCIIASFESTIQIAVSAGR